MVIQYDVKATHLLERSEFLRKDHLTLPGLPKALGLTILFSGPKPNLASTRFISEGKQHQTCTSW